MFSLSGFVNFRDKVDVISMSLGKSSWKSLLPSCFWWGLGRLIIVEFSKVEDFGERVYRHRRGSRQFTCLFVPLPAGAVHLHSRDTFGCLFAGQSSFLVMKNGLYFARFTQSSTLRIFVTDDREEIVSCSPLFYWSLYINEPNCSTVSQTKLGVVGHNKIGVCDFIRQFITKRQVLFLRIDWEWITSMSEPFLNLNVYKVASISFSPVLNDIWALWFRNGAILSRIRRSTPVRRLHSCVYLTA